MEAKYSTRSPAVKRLMREASELRAATSQYFAQPLEDNLFEWHFTVRGPSDTDFAQGVYHGRIVLPPDYPMKPPNIIILTPNGRFEVNKKICLSISGHHPETWQPSWSIRTALLAIIGFMPTPGKGTIGALDYTPQERRALAKKSLEYYCPVCKCFPASLLLPEDAEEGQQAQGAEGTRKEADDVVKNFDLKGSDETLTPSQSSSSLGKDASSSNNEASSSSVKNDATQNESTLSPEVLERKRKSQAAQDRFRRRLAQRTTHLRAQLEALDPSSPPSSTTNTTTTTNVRSGRESIYDWLIVLLALAIAVIVVRRVANSSGVDAP